MTWVVPDIVPADELFQGGEREMLQGFLQHARESLLTRCAGLTPEQLVSRSAPPSTLSLLGIVRHLTDVERDLVPHPVRRAGPSRRCYRTAENPDCAFDAAEPEDRRR